MVAGRQGRIQKARMEGESTSESALVGRALRNRKQVPKRKAPVILVGINGGSDRRVLDSSSFLRGEEFCENILFFALEHQRPFQPFLVVFKAVIVEHFIPD